VSELGQALGIGPPIDFEGKTYIVTPFDIGQAAEFEYWMEAELWRSVERQRNASTPQAHQERVAATLEVIGGGGLKYGTQLHANMAKSIEGRTYLLYLMLKVRQPDVSLDVARRMLDSEMKAFFEALQRKIFDPNSSTPEKKTPGEETGENEKAA
jgi:hypothetical protein